MKNFAVYSFSYNNPSRFERMSERFSRIGVPLHWVPSVARDDPRIVSSQDARVQSIMYSHLDMLKAFIDSPAEYGIFCEDDIYIHKDFNALLSQAIDAYDRLELDVILLGYLLSYKPIAYTISPYHSLLFQPITVMSYTDDVWGSQMYMCNKTVARRILEIFANPLCTNLPFSPDWCITKFGKRGLVYPMLAVEEGEIQVDCESQSVFHERCKATHYDPSIYM